MGIAVSKGVTMDIGAEKTAVAHLTKIDGLDQTAETIDTTELADTSGYNSFIGGQKDGGEVSVEGYFDATDTGQTEMLSAYTSGEATAFNIHFPTAVAKKWSFNAVVTEFKTGFELNALIAFTAKLKVSGAPTLAAEAGA